MIQLEVGYDGANPQAAAAIGQVSTNRFRLRPFSEDGDANYKFALNVRVRNDGGASSPLTLEIGWADVVYREARTYVHFGSGDDWALVPCQADGAVTVASLDVPPGVSYVGLSPAYGLGEYQAFAAGLPGLGYERWVVGRSEQGREIEAWRIGRGPRRVLVTSRFHPYETAASYWAEGALSWLARPGERQTQLRREFTFAALPMPNPDGVRLGLCKRTAVADGVDLSHEGAFRRDSTGRALLAAVDELRPAGLIDVHGWMYFREDGLHYVDETLRQRFEAGLVGHPLFAGNIWKGSRGAIGPNDGSTLHYCARQHGTLGLSVSYRWPSRTVPQMRALGGPTLEAFCAAL